MIFKCPCCQRTVLVLKEVGKAKRCPYCDCEVSVQVEKKPVIALLLAMFALPFLFWQELESLLPVDRRAATLYFALYYVVLFVVALVIIYRISHWEVARKPEERNSFTMGGQQDPNDE